MPVKNLNTCSQGHKFIKSSNCPFCPICENERKPPGGFLSLLSAPARRALENNHIKSLKQLSKFTEKEILSFHGLGPSTIPILKKALNAQNLSFKKPK